MYILNILSTMENDKRFEDFIFVSYYRQTGFTKVNSYLVKRQEKRLTIIYSQIDIKNT